MVSLLELLGQTINQTHCCSTCRNFRNLFTCLPSISHLFHRSSSDKSILLLFWNPITLIVWLLTSCTLTSWSKGLRLSATLPFSFVNSDFMQALYCSNFSFSEASDASDVCVAWWDTLSWCSRPTCCYFIATGLWRYVYLLVVLYSGIEPANILFYTLI